MRPWEWDTPRIGATSRAGRGCAPSQTHRFRGHSVYGKLFQKSACAVGWGAVIYFLARSGNASADAPLGCRLMAGQRILVPSMGVRLPPSQPSFIWPVRLAVQDAALSRRRSPVRIWYGLPNVQPGSQDPGFCFLIHVGRSPRRGGSECRPRRAMRPAARHSAGPAGATAPFGCADGCDGPVSYSRFDGGALCPSWQDCDIVWIFQNPSLCRWWRRRFPEEMLSD